MTPLQQEPSAHAPWMRTIFGRVFISGIPSWLRLMAILRSEAAAGVSAALLHFADACCAAGMAVPPVWPAGKVPRDFGLDRAMQLAGVRQRAEIIQLPPTTPALADRTLGAADRGRPRADRAWAGTRTLTLDSSAPHAPRSRIWARARLAHRRHPARRARREAIGLPRSGDPLRALLGAATAAATQMPPRGDACRGSPRQAFSVDRACCCLGEGPELGGRPDGLQDHLRHRAGIGDH